MLTDASHFDQDTIGFQNASFTWSNDEPDGTLTPSRRRFTLRVRGELLFKRGCINLIIGPTGSGKTSLLMALLGEMHFIPMSPDSWYHLPRAGGVSYAAQESWVQNETIRVRATMCSRLCFEILMKYRITSCLELPTTRRDITKVVRSHGHRLWLTSFVKSFISAACNAISACSMRETRRKSERRD